MKSITPMTRIRRVAVPAVDARFGVAPTFACLQGTRVPAAANAHVAFGVVDAIAGLPAVLAQDTTPVAPRGAPV